MIDVKLPQFGMGMTEAVITKWLKTEGDLVEADEPIVEIEAEKTAAEVVAPESGRLASIVFQEGETVEVYTVIATIADGDTSEGGSKKGNGAALPAEGAQTVSVKGPLPQSGETNAPNATPLARRLAQKHGIDIASISGTGARGRVTDKDVAAAVDAGSRTAPQGPANGAPRATPLARRMAKENGVDIAQVTGTGKDGRITDKDVEAFLAEGGSPPEQQPTGELIPLTGMRGAIAKRMHRSLQESAQLTLTRTIDVTALVAHRAHLKNEQNITVSYNDLIVRIVVLALKEHPRLNATIGPEGITVHSQINIGIAVALEDGLIVPVLHNADTMSLSDIKKESARLADLVKSGEAPPQAVSNGTFTISNLGAFGIEAFTPVINPPEVAILGVGALTDHAARRPEGGLVWRKTMSFSLTIDHRAVDGAPGAMFLQTVVEIAAAPEGRL